MKHDTTVDKSQFHDFLQSLTTSLLDQDPQNYKLLGLVWQQLVEERIAKSLDSLHSVVGSSSLPEFNRRVSIKKLPIRRLPLTRQSYFVLDGYLESIKHHQFTEAIIEIKLGPSNLGLKEIEYLYYHPSAIMLVILFYPNPIHFPKDLFSRFIEPLVTQFQELNHLPEFTISASRIYFVGRSSLRLDQVTEHTLRQYEGRIHFYSKYVLALLSAVAPRSLIKEDIIACSGAHHQVIANVLDNLQDLSIVVYRNCDILNSIDRLSSDVRLYRLNPELMSCSSLHQLVKEMDLDRQNLALIPDRVCYQGIRPNDYAILCYLSHHPQQWIAVPDLLDSVNFSSQGEMRRRLDALEADGKIKSTTGYQLDLSKTRTKAYLAHFYQLKQSFSHEECSATSQSPSRIRTSLNLTVIELKLLQFLDQHRINKEDPIAIKDLATCLKLDQTTILYAIKRLEARDDVPLTTISGWVLSTTGKIKLRKSPVVYLKSRFDLEGIPTMDIPDLSRKMEILEVPLTPNERAVYNLVRQGHDLDTIYQLLPLNSIPKSNRSMIKAIINRLADANTMAKRDLPPLLTIDPKLRCSVVI